MARKASLQPSTALVRERRPNGDIYIYQRETLYDPECRYARTLHKKLIGKIPAGGTEVVPTRPKAPAKKKTPAAAGSTEGRTWESSAPVKKPADMMDILEFIGRQSGIDDALAEASPNKETAAKVISLARYIVASGGAPLSGIAAWQLNHRIPYPEELHEQACSALFTQLGQDCSIPQLYSALLARNLNISKLQVFAVSVCSACSTCFGCRTGEDAATASAVYLVTYSAETGQPFSLVRLSSQFPDGSSVGDAVRQSADAFGADWAEVCLDADFCSLWNLQQLARESVSFLMPIREDQAWVQPLIDAHREALNRNDTICPFEPALHAITIPVQRPFRNSYAGKGEEEETGTVLHMYLHIYCSSTEASAAKANFEAELQGIRQVLLENPAIAGLPDAMQEKAKTYLDIQWNRDAAAYEVGFNQEACRRRQQYFGLFCLLSDSEADAFAVLTKYRRREVLEDFFQIAADGTDPGRSWEQRGAALDGRAFVQFIALSYREYFAMLVRRMKETLAASAENPDLPAAARTLDRSLLDWVRSHSLSQQLTWFDARDPAAATAGIAALRWSAEALQQNRRYLQLLGMPPEA